MNPKKIGPLYKELSEHFDVPMIDWEILPKPEKKQINRFILENRELPGFKFHAKMEELPLGVIITSIEEEDAIDLEKKVRITKRNVNLVREEGRFIKEPTPKIVFFGAPTLKTVMHEFMHYLVYCAKKKE